MSQLLEVPQCPCLSPLTQVFRKKGWAWRAVVHDRTWRTTSGWGSPVTSYSSELTLDNSSHSSPSSPVGQYCISVQSVSSVAQLCPTLQPCGLQHTRLPCPSPTSGAYSNLCPLSWWCHPTILSSVVPFFSCLQSFPTSGSFSSESVLRMRWPKYWSFSLTISPSNEYSGLISFRTEWLDLLAAQGTLKSLLQHHSSKASILRHSAFFMVKLSHPYMTTGKTIALTIWTFVGIVFTN